MARCQAAEIAHRRDYYSYSHIFPVLRPSMAITLRYKLVGRGVSFLIDLESYRLTGEALNGPTPGKHVAVRSGQRLPY